LTIPFFRVYLQTTPRTITTSSSSKPRLGKVAAWAEHLAAIFGVSRLVAFAVSRRNRDRNGDEPIGVPPSDGDDGGERNGDYKLYEVIPAWERYKLDTETLPQWLKRTALGRERTPIPSHIGCVESPPPNGAEPKTGVCCSGGGIRSAAFNLGALQQIQGRDGEWQDVKYLAAVSGGSYIAAAFSMVAKTKDPEREKETEDDSDIEVFRKGRLPFYHGSPEEQYLRNRSSYMAPGGVGRARLILRVALGLLFNLAFIGAAVVLIAWLLAVFYRQFHSGLQGPAEDAFAGTTEFELWLTAGIAGAGLLFGAISVWLRSVHDRAQRALETLALRTFVVAAGLLAFTLAIPELVEFLRNTYGGGGAGTVSTTEAKGGAGIAAGGGFGALLLAALLELRSKLKIDSAAEVKAWYQKLAAPLRRAIAQIAIWLAGPLLITAALILALVWMIGSEEITAWPIVVVGIVFTWFWFFSDVTSWSLHPFYRRRLCTAFALKRVRRGGDRPGDFGIALERDYTKLVPLSESGVKPGSGPFKAWPTLVVCAAANVSDPGATPPGREVTSFTFSPVAMGGPLVGGVSTKAFEDYITPTRKRDFTLAAAVAMSGAAVAPSMGKETRASVRFLLALANVRLGVWVPNPRRAERWLERPGGVRSQLSSRINRYEGPRVDAVPGAVAISDRRFRRWVTAPRPSPWYLIKEMLGKNSVNDPYLYVTDGGHYENLGLVELLRRGCTEIFCFDASGGTRLDALGDAIALARSELRIEIQDLDVSPLEENDDRLAEHCCVRGRIKYPDGPNGEEGPEGVLIYARNVVTKDAAYDVQAFRIRDKRFPHHSTLDQLYTDEKFEAYRELGAHAGRAALEEAANARAERFGLSASNGAAAPERRPALT
jgi:Patatin-like phospholipase